MNSKIKNYVDVLFKGIPNTKKAQELHEEILSNLNEHFEEHIAEGKSENQAYTAALSDLGDVDELLKTLEPEQALKDKIDSYRKVKARNTSISVMLYILGAMCLIGFACFSEMTGIGKEDALAIAGFIVMLGFVAVATAILVYTHMSMPQDVAQYITKGGISGVTYDTSNKTLRSLAAFMKLYWCAVLLIYLAISFATGRWAITWIIWVIATAVKNALFIFLDTSDDEIDSFNKD